jgi:hypothetical protein
MLSFLLGAYKWKMLFNTFHAKSQFSDFLSACFKGAFIANFMFGSLLGDGARIYDISKKYNIKYPTLNNIKIRYVTRQSCQ